MPAGSKKWDSRYRDIDRYPGPLDARTYLKENKRFLPDKGLALDAACGLGGNSAFLINCGLDVIGVDSSMIGITRAHAAVPGLMAVAADMARIEFPPGSLDVIINFFFLERKLFQDYCRWLKPDGLLIFETLTREMLDIKPDLNPEYLIGTGELRQALSDWRILDYYEGWHHSPDGKSRATACAIARPPGK